MQIMVLVIIVGISVGKYRDFTTILALVMTAQH